MICHLPHHLFLYWFFPRALTATCQAYFADTSLNGIFGVPAGTYFPLFLLTNCLELPFYFYTFRGQALAHKLGRLLLLNLATHPLVALGFPQFFALAGYPRAWALFSSELFAPALEAGLLVGLWRVPLRHAALTAFAANLFSWEIGGLLLGLF